MDRTTRTKTTEELIARAARHLAAAIERTLGERGACTLGIVGGRSIPALLDALRAELAGKRLEGRIDAFWLDERVDPDKNFLPALPALEALRAHLDLAWHPLLGTAREAMMAEAAACQEKLERLGGVFDIVVLSAGEDGHVASLFPRHPALRERERRYMLVEGAPKPPQLRVSVSIPLLRTAREALLLFSGSGKREAYARFCDPAVGVEGCPAKSVKDVAHVFVCVDEE